MTQLPKNSSTGSLVRTLKIQGVSLVLAFLSLGVAGISVSEAASAQQHTTRLATCRQHVFNEVASYIGNRTQISNDQFALIGAQIKADNDFIVLLLTSPNISKPDANRVVAAFLANNQKLVQQQKMLAAELKLPVPQPPNVVCN